MSQYRIDLVQPWDQTNLGQQAHEMELREAVTQGDVLRLAALLAQGATLDAKDEDERTPLHWASATGRFDVVEFLLDEAGVRVNVQDDAGWTPLMSAASAGFAPVVSLLLIK